MTTRTSRLCTEVQRVLPALRDSRLHGWRARAVRIHLRRCPDCRAERDLLDTLAMLKSTHRPEPPAGLLADLLAGAAGGGARAKVVAPARGAVSGARPVLSAALLLGAAVVGTGAGFGVRRGVRRIRRR